VKKALIVVDIQNDFCPGGKLPVPKGDEIVPMVNALQEKFELVVATQDWHPSDHLSFASNHKMRPGEVIELDGMKQTLWPNHCVQEMQGAEFVAELDTHKIQKYFKKVLIPNMTVIAVFLITLIKGQRDCPTT